MPANSGELVFDALLALGYTVEVADDGRVLATKGEQTLSGKAGQGTIEWMDRGLAYQVLEQAYIARLRQRIATSGTNASRDSTLGASTR